MKEIFMKRWLTCLLLTISLNAYSSKPYSCDKWLSWFKPACLRLHQVWNEGAVELYIPGYAWHNRYTYSAERVKKYNEAALGGGLGKGLIDEQGNWHGIYAFAFLESHKKLEPIAGYAYLKLKHFNHDIKAGIGLSAFLTARPDINNGIPFPGALPWISVMIKHFTLSATYIPGHRDIGNVLFVFGKYTF